MDLLKVLGLQNDYSSAYHQAIPPVSLPHPPHTVIHPHQLPVQSMAQNSPEITIDHMASDRSRMATLNGLFGTNPVADPSSIEKAAKLYRNAACRSFTLKVIATFDKNFATFSLKNESFSACLHMHSLGSMFP